MYITNFWLTSAYYEAFNVRVIHFFEAGLLTHLVSNYTVSNIKTVDIVIIRDKFKSDFVESLEYFAFNTHFNVLFIILLFGYVVSVLVFLAEVVYGRLCEKKQIL